MTERWETVEQIAAARARFIAGIPGWTEPAAYGLGRAALDRAGGGRIIFARVNAGDHPLPAVVLATVCGHRTGSAAYRLDRTTLGRAIELLAPAEACRAYDHPNLAAWRRVYGELPEDGEAVAVFLGDPARPDADPYVAQLRDAVRWVQPLRPAE